MATVAICENNMELLQNEIANCENRTSRLASSGLDFNKPLNYNKYVKLAHTMQMVSQLN